MYKDDGIFDEYYDEFFSISPGEDPIKICLKRIYELEMSVKCLYDLVPIKYKKFNTLAGENPFFPISKIKPSNEDYEEAKKRMAELLKD